MRSAEREEALKVLRHNVGFSRPESWIDFAIRRRLRPVEARRVPRCPDCGSRPRGELGQYVYYSTLIHLRSCTTCGLIWADAQVDREVVAGEFETAFGSRDYFVRRAEIYHHLAAEIAGRAPPGARVLDIGGAHGDLMYLLRHRRPDLTAVVHDVSRAATRYAKERFGLPALTGDITTLRRHDVRYEVVVLSDVLYYEPRLTEFWELLPRLVAPAGTVVLRVPNKLGLIRVRQAWARFLRARRTPAHNIAHFNPAHLYVFTRRYLERRLQRAGFSEVQVAPTPLLMSPSLVQQPLARWYFRLAAAVARASHTRWIMTPSLLVFARLNEASG